MKHNLCVKISYKKYLLANTSFPQPVVLQYTSGVGRACSPRLGLKLDLRTTVALLLEKGGLSQSQKLSRKPQTKP